MWYALFSSCTGRAPGVLCSICLFFSLLSLLLPRRIIMSYVSLSLPLLLSSSLSDIHMLLSLFFSPWEYSILFSLLPVSFCSKVDLSCIALQANVSVVLLSAKDNGVFLLLLAEQHGNVLRKVAGRESRAVGVLFFCSLGIKYSSLPGNGHALFALLLLLLILFFLSSALLCTVMVCSVPLAP
jgi:hypothetical protein